MGAILAPASGRSSWQKADIHLTRKIPRTRWKGRREQHKRLVRVRFCCSGRIQPNNVRQVQGFCDVAHGAAISLFMFPVLFALVILMLRYIRRHEI